MWQDINFWAQWGLAGVVVGITLWLAHHRELWQRRELEEQRRWIQEKLVGVIENNTAALRRLEREWDLLLKRDSRHDC